MAAHPLQFALSATHPSGSVISSRVVLGWRAAAREFGVSYSYLRRMIYTKGTHRRKILSTDGSWTYLTITRL